MRWLRERFYAVSNWWFDMLRAREDRRRIEELFELLMSEDTPGCDVCDENPKLCICGELEDGADCD